MGTPEQKYKWRQNLIAFLLSALLLLVGFGLNRIGVWIDDIKDQNDKIAQTQLNTYKLFEIEYKSTDYALMVIHDGQYTNLKQEKKQELMKDYEFKNKSKGD